MRNLTIVLLFISINSFGQLFETEKNIAPVNQYFKYNEDVIFVITKMREEKNTAGFGYEPLRGYTAYVMYLMFQNRSNETQEVDLSKIFLANPLTKQKFEVKWYNTAGIGSMSKPTFKLKSKKKKNYILFYIYEINQKLFFLIDGKLTEIQTI